MQIHFVHNNNIAKMTVNSIFRQLSLCYEEGCLLGLFCWVWYSVFLFVCFVCLFHLFELTFCTDSFICDTYVPQKLHISRVREFCGKILWVQGFFTCFRRAKSRTTPCVLQSSAVIFHKLSHLRSQYICSGCLFIINGLFS